MQITNRLIDQQIKTADLSTVFDAKVKTILDGAKEAEQPPAQYAEELTDLCQWFEESEETTADARKLAERDRDYYDGNQLTEKERQTLRKRGQPEIIINYIKRKVEFMRGFERRMRSDPKAFPRNPQDEQTAGAATDALRFVADQNDFDETRSSVYENLIVEGFGGAEVTVVTMPDGQTQVEVQRVPWDRLVYDPHSRLPDFSDAAYKGIVIWMDGADAKRKWAGNADAIDETFRSVNQNDTYGDRPGNAWCDSKRKRVRVVQMHYKREDQWMVATYTKGGFLEEPVPSPYVDKYGQSVSSLIMRSAYIDRENNRYGAVRDLISLQDEINKRRSKALHLLSVRQTYGNKQAIQDTQEAQLQLAKPDGHVELNGGSTFGQDFGVLPTGDMAQGQISLMQQSVMEMQASGPNAAMAGKDPRAQSGRALEAQAQGGSIEMEPLVDELRQWTRDVYEAVWMRVRQFWTDETWVRVTDDERNIKFVGLNKKVTVADKLAQMPPELRAQWMQSNQVQPNDPRLQEVIEVENDVSGLDVDIVVEEGPDVAVLQSEQFEQLAKLAQGGINIPPKALVMASSLRNKEQILDEMENGGLPPKVQAEMQKLQEQLQKLTEENTKLKGEGNVKLAELALDRERFEWERSGGGQQPQQPDMPEPINPKDLADADLKRAQTEKTQADAEKVRVETALLLTQPAEGAAGEVDPETGEAKPSDSQQILGAVQQLTEVVMAPKAIVRDPATKEILGVQQGDMFHPVQRDESGLISGLQ